jgi:hypothetical protein
MAVILILELLRDKTLPQNLKDAQMSLVEYSNNVEGL